MVFPIDTVCPKLSEKEGGQHRGFYSNYTIKDYLTLDKGSIFTASGKLAPLSGAQTTLTRQMEPLPSEDKLIIV